MQTDILASVPITVTGQVTAQNGGALGRVRIKGVYIVPAAGAGSVVLREGGASGTVKATLNTLAAATSPIYMCLPGEGLLFQADVHATITDVASATFFYG